ncbi:unnamed protein product [Arabis nemorensis]|uniref:Uncharacterized protein n=1 Tax=Arabis nemorensis TaxID=586526 RepID=A0A565C7Z8_9BRAS|nr:unnamed protein product [Arabis nemorensis]
MIGCVIINCGGYDFAWFYAQFKEIMGWIQGQLEDLTWEKARDVVREIVRSVMTWFDSQLEIEVREIGRKIKKYSQ